MYTVTYSPFIRMFVVRNPETGLAQSSWDNRLAALCAARDLNLKAKADLSRECVSKTTQLQSSLKLLKS